MIEMIVKILGFGIRDYFRDPYNSFDCFLVIASAIDIGLNESKTI